MKQELKKPRSKNHEIIGNLIAPQYMKEAGFWPREMKFASALIKKYGAEFMTWVKPPQDYKINTLLFFSSDLGKRYLSDQLVEYQKQSSHLFPVQTTVPIPETKVGEDIVVESKPKTLKEFLLWQSPKTQNQ